MKKHEEVKSVAPTDDYLRALLMLMSDEQKQEVVKLVKALLQEE